jgi:hypothetical protein
LSTFIFSAGIAISGQFELEELFRYEVFKMLKTEGKITNCVIENMMNWRHSGFNVYCGRAIWPHNEEALN